MGSFFVYSDNICLSDSHRLLSIISFVGFHFQLGSKLISSFHSLSLSHTLIHSLSLPLSHSFLFDLRRRSSSILVVPLLLLLHLHLHFPRYSYSSAPFTTETPLR